MTVDGFFRLAMNTVTAPRDVARLLLSLNLPHQALWLAFSLVIVLNTLMFSLSVMVMPASDMVAPVLGSPIVFGAMLAVSVAALIFMVTVSGRVMDGAAGFAQIAVLVIWLQALRVLVQGVVVLLGPVSGTLSGIVVLAASLLGVWIFVNFIAVAHETGGLLKAGFILLLAVAGMMLALSLIFSLLGVPAGGLSGYV
ncbi:YIP1 family protein [Marivita sp. GX14005]|uniref:YIP1 family protein n=1 Tax=Marivita sp. GX14005 TaxID=2942276 RepID=UPI002018806B|nr:YIP1 family protein [Marivita sp. GX14005]MCL3883503.1 YIP1 family protein [Marivita sp. GX14005]